MQIESPGHGGGLSVFALGFLWEIHEVGYALVNLWLWTFGFDWDHVGVISLDWFFLQVELYIIKTSTLLFHWYPYLLVGEETVVVHVLELNRTVKGNCHPYLFVGSVGQHFEYQYFLQLLCHLHQKCPVGSPRGLDGSWEVGVRIRMFEDDEIAEANFIALFTE